MYNQANKDYLAKNWRWILYWGLVPWPAVCPLIQTILGVPSSLFMIYSQISCLFIQVFLASHGLWGQKLCYKAQRDVIQEGAVSLGRALQNNSDQTYVETLS